MNPDDTAPATPFTAELTDDAGHVAGRTVEPDMFGGPYAPPIPALIDGSHADGELTFTKFPEGGGQTHTIDYAGTISGDGNVIAGRWIIYGVWEGTFQMQRRVVSADKAAERETAIQT